MKKQYAQYAQQELGVGAVGVLDAPVGMQSMYFDFADTGHPKRIDSNGIIYPVGGVRIINESGNVGWSFSRSRVNTPTIGVGAIDLSLEDASNNGAIGLNSIAIGDAYAAGNYTIAIGTDVRMLGGLAIGHHIEPIFNSIILGMYNEGVTGSLFEIGVGYFDDPSEIRQNAMTIAVTGVASTPLADKANIVNPKDLVTLEKLEDSIIEADPDYDEHTFSIKGDISDDSYLGFLPYIPLGTTKKVIGMRWFLRTGSCNITLVEYGNITDSTIFNPLLVTGAVIGQFIHADPLNYYDLTDGDRVQLEVTNATNAIDLSVTVIVLRGK